MRFVHLADVHLDTPFSTRSPRVRARLRQASRDAFEAAVDLALTRGVHAFLIAGDLFDGDRLSFQTETFLLEQLVRLRERGITVIYATGNHDPGAPGHRSLHIAWPEGVIVVSGPAPTRTGVRDAEGHLVGFVTASGHASSRETGNLAGAFPTPSGSLPEVALLHTQVVGSLDEGAHQPYAPSTLEGLRTAGYDYWALGHVHLRQALSSDPPVHYPGNPQGRTPREDGPRGGLLVDLSDRNRPEVTFHPLGPVRWARLTVDRLETCRNLDELVDRIVEAWRTHEQDTDTAPSDTLLHLVLTGPCPLWRPLAQEEERDALAERVAARLGLFWVDAFADDVHPLVDVHEHVDRPDVLGAVLRLVADTASGTLPPPTLDPEELAAAQLWGMRDPGAYLAGLLQGAQEDVLFRMLDRETGR